MVSPAAFEDFEPRAQDDPRDKAVIWLSDVWHDQHPREWVTPECRTICSTTQGALNAVAQLTEFVHPAEHRGVVRKYVYNRLGLHPQAYKCEHPKVEMAKAIRLWACALNQTFLIVTDKGGGHIAETWRACGLTGQGQVGRREAQRIFREHGLLLVIDLVQLRTVALMIHPDKKASFEGDLLKWTVHEHLAAPPPVVVARPPTPHPATDMDARVRAALDSAGRAIAATGDAGNRVLILNFEKQGVMQMADAICKHTNV